MGVHINKCINNHFWMNSQKCPYCGEALIEKLIEYCKNENISEINLEVRMSNLVAQSLYKKMGFSEVGQRPNYYENRETAILMKQILTEEE